MTTNDQKHWYIIHLPDSKIRLRCHNGIVDIAHGARWALREPIHIILDHYRERNATIEILPGE